MAGRIFAGQELRLWPSIDVDHREKLPFPVVREILLKVSFSPGFTIHHAFAGAGRANLGPSGSPASVFQSGKIVSGNQSLK